ncbi:DUF523 domain-containing protein [Marinobacterium lutimaris]|uniref:Uncharacterized conserved protein YbbK, DUF523 family n=1 Tax=Marinobacterium lutimaris TaxID=568106 RepID=A0A1H5WTH7_9GAMM|nr:DUF523 domain-containing protein [Marinobacterium lutimaris]SEG02721.1 Uncharacterized conserved protein YbbK, DUF523 family [Marinobacterium lutimaris]
MEKILVSACLLGAEVRYDGKHNLIDHPVIARWKQEGRLVALCPEVLGGLPTPRPPAEVQSRFPLLVTSRDGEDFTPQFLSGAEQASDIARAQGCCCALMKARSPSCGNRSSYDGSFTGRLISSPGVTANELIREGTPVFNEEEIEQLISFIESREQHLDAEPDRLRYATCD